MSVAAAFPKVSPAELTLGAGASLLDAHRLISIGACMDSIRGVPGDTAEVGIAAGGTTRLISRANGGRIHWACDTFDGLMDCDTQDAGLTNKMFQNVRPPVEQFLADCDNVRLVPGYFPVSAPSEMAVARFAFVHIDVDTYHSIINCFEFFSARMSPGGFIALDDVLPKGSGCPGAQQAWREIVGLGGAWRFHSQASPQVVVRFE